MQHTPTDFSDRSFGGLNVILCGDLHQFPPVAVKDYEIIYRPLDSTRDGFDTQVGWRLYEEFTTVVKLTQQRQVTDLVWKAFLGRLRVGDASLADVSLLKSLVLTPKEAAKIRCHEPPWADACLVTPRHSVRRHWNSAAVCQWCARSGNRLMICNAEDTISPKSPHRMGRIIPKHRDGHDHNLNTKTLPPQIELAIGMKVMVTENIETDLDITNGAKGVITDIVLHPDEPPFEPGSVVVLKHLPAFILVKLDRTKTSRLAGLESGVIPVEPRKISMKFDVEDKGVIKSCAGSRRQFPMTAAYAFTDYRAQGQTIDMVIIDIARPPRATLSLFNLYVALSRSSGTGTIRLLRDFDEGTIRQKHDLDLLAEDGRLDKLDKRTERWWESIRVVDA